jgi:hypothetical protein
MANFVLLYSGGRMPETEAEQAAVLKAWTDWYGRLGRGRADQRANRNDSTTVWYSLSISS